MKEESFLPKETEEKLKEKAKLVSTMDKTELNKFIQELLTHQENLENQNLQLKSTQNELRALHERYFDLFDNAPVGYFTLNDSFIIQDANHTACLNFGLKPEEVTGITFKNFVDDEYHNIFSSCFKEFTFGNQTSSCDLKLNSGNSTFFARIIVAAFGDQGKPDDFRIAVIDITKEKELEEKLIEASGKARENERLKSAFMANMSHEIRTPMNGIIGFAELLQDPDLSPTNLQSYLNIIQNSGKRMLSIINELFDISKIESGSVRPVKANTNVDELLEYLYEFFLPEATKKGLDFSVTSKESDEKLIVKTDKEKLHAIFVNLLKNAISFTSEGNVKFGYSKKDDQLDFYVSDTGIGISEDEQKRIFERFYRADEKPSGRTEGVGLGLPISKAFVEMLGGTIRVESDPGTGSTFHFTIPLSENKENIAGKIRPESIDDPSELLSYLSILVAEDDEPARLYLSELLKNKCKKIYFANNGRQAVDIYSEIKPDLVLMDIKMPVMDGYSAAIKIKGMDENALIIAQTAYALAGDREKALAAGCSDYLAKPVMNEDVLRMIQKHLI